MPMLDCNVRTCYYNKEYRCSRDGIQVEGEEARTSGSTACGSYKERSEGSFTNSADGNYSGRPQMELAVNCEAVNCTYNEECRCHADHIGIGGGEAHDTEETECSTFSRKEE